MDAATPRDACAGDDIDCDDTDATANPEHSDACPTSLGHDQASGALPRKGNHDDLLATPVTLSQNATLRQLGVVTTADSVGGLVMLALYADTVDGLGNHTPGMRLAATEAHTLLADSQNLHAPVVSNIQLTANTLYWVAVKLSEEAGDDIMLARFSASTIDGWSTRYAVSSDVWDGAAPPASFPVGITNPGELAIFMRVRP